MCRDYWHIIPSNHFTSAQFQSGKPGDRQDPSDDPKPNDDRRFFPAFLLEVMVERRHAEYSASRHLEARDLNDDRDRLQNKQTAYDREHKLVFCNHTDRPESSADRQRSGVSHKDHCRRGVEPQETKARPDHGAAKDGELTGAADMVDL